MRARLQVSYEFVKEAAQSPSVRAALAARAAKVQRRAESLAKSEDVALDSKITNGTRPKGRPYSRVESPNVGQEFGDSITVRRRIMGRAAEGS